MCGIVGIWGPSGEQHIGALCLALRHRGPDAQGEWLDGRAGVALGHRRLAVIDLTETGSQPMASKDGRYRLVFNGEIYNFRELRGQLERSGHEFAGGSDTEVLLVALLHWGAEAVLPRLNGMFALALWDAQEHRLLLARDRFGKKPLYYGLVGPDFVFASELKALRCLPQPPTRLHSPSVEAFFRFGYVPSPLTIYENIWKLPPGCYLWQHSGAAVAEPKSYLVESPVTQERPTMEGLELTLRQAVARRLVSDVPLGAFLSGGIDSSLIVALMQECAAQPVRTYTIGFAESSHDEATYAAAVGRHLGTRHTEYRLTVPEALQQVTLLPTVYDEPFADPSGLPTLLVSQLARKHVTVVLSGDGGDEVFGGYNRYLWAPRLWSFLKRFPLSMRRLLFRVLGRVPIPTGLSRYSDRMAHPLEKATKLLGLLDAPNAEELYLRLCSQWSRPHEVTSARGFDELAMFERVDRNRPMVEWMMRLDQLTYLPDDILVKVDRATMSVGLEARSPFLDPEVVLFAARFSIDEKIRGNRGKLPLRELLARRLPPELFERPKTGFSMPLGEWLRGGLRDWAEDFLSERALMESGYLRPQGIRLRWREHLARKRDWSASLWTVIMFQAWLRNPR